MGGIRTVKMRNITLIAVLTSLLLQGCQASESLPATGEYRSGLGRFDRTMMRLMEKWDIPGGALAILQDGEIILSRGYGYADMDSGELVQPNSLFRIASLSKPVTAAAVLKLVEDGKLELDAPVFQILDDLRPPEGAQIDPRIYGITIRHLLEHTGGWDRNTSFDPMFRVSEIAQEMKTPSPADCPTIIRYMLEQPLDFDPGSQYAYSNFGYCILGRVIEKVSGQAYEAYVKDHILEPVGIDDMRLGHSLLADRAEGEVRYYGREPDHTQPVFPDIEGTVPWPYGGFYIEAMDSHGGWIASAIDLARFAYALEIDNPQAILKPESLELMLSRPDISIWDGKSSYYALGWQVRPAWKGTNSWHSGSLPGTTTMLYRTSDGLIWAALFNSHSDTSDDEFFVDLITEMGEAAFLDNLIIYSGLLLAFIIGVIFFIVQRKRRKNIPAVSNDQRGQA